MSSSVAARAGSPRRSPAWLFPALLTLGSLIVWGVIFRSWIMMGDDYLFMAQFGRPGHDFTFAEWWSALAEDWGVRNGRLADGVLRAVLRPGTWLYPLLAPVMLTATGVAAAWTISLGRDSAGVPLWLWLAGLLAVPVTVWNAPSMAGDAIYWAAGGINYALPLVLLLCSIGLYAVAIQRPDLHWGWVAAGAVLLVLTDALQELSALALFVITVVVLIHRWGTMTPKLWTLVGSALAAFAVHMSAPGLHQRGDIVAEGAIDSPILALVHSLAWGSSALWAKTSLVWISLVAALAVLAASQWVARPRTARLALTGAIAGAVFSLAASSYLARWLPTRGLVEGTTDKVPAQAWLLMLIMIATMAVIGLVFLMGAEVFGLATPLLWAGYVGACMPSFAVGVAGSRAQFMPAVLILLVVVSIAFRFLPTRPGVQRLAAAAVIGSMLLPSLLWADAASAQAARNKEFAETEIIGPLLEARESGATRVVVPEKLPFPGLGYAKAFDMERYHEDFRVYYDLPEGTEIVHE